jgi:hypothetical protein
MRTRTLLLLLALIGIAVFAAVNWTAITTPTTLSLVVTTVEAPIGLIMLSLTTLLTVLFLVFVAYWQTTVILEARRHTHELQEQRRLADQAEASRFTELRGFLETELRKLGDQSVESRATVAARLDQIEQSLRAEVEQAGNTLSAYIGELEDRLESKAGDRSRTGPSDRQNIERDRSP